MTCFGVLTACCDSPAVARLACERRYELVWMMEGAVGVEVVAVGATDAPRPQNKLQ